MPTGRTGRAAQEQPKALRDSIVLLQSAPDARHRATTSASASADDAVRCDASAIQATFRGSARMRGGIYVSLGRHASNVGVGAAMGYLLDLPGGVTRSISAEPTVNPLCEKKAIGALLIFCRRSGRSCRIFPTGRGPEVGCWPTRWAAILLVQMVLNYVACQVCIGAHVHFFQDASAVGAYGLDAQVQTFPDSDQRLTAADPQEDFEFPLG